MSGEARRKIALVPKGVPVPLPRGHLMNAEEIASEFFGWVKGVTDRNARSPKWVRENIPHPIRLGHSTKRWYRQDVLDYIESCREAAA